EPVEPFGPDLRGQGVDGAWCRREFGRPVSAPAELLGDAGSHLGSGGVDDRDPLQPAPAPQLPGEKEADPEQHPAEQRPDPAPPGPYPLQELAPHDRPDLTHRVARRPAPPPG